MIREYPPILNGKSENQTMQIRAYLVRLVQSINETVREIQEAVEDVKTRIDAIPGQTSSKKSQAVKPAELYDVGDIFITTRSGDPATLLGYGTWTRVKDRFLLAAGDTYTADDTGGEASHTLTMDEMPAHTHKDTLTNVASTVTDGYPMVGGYTVARSDAAIGGSAGGGQAHNNMPPYLVVNVWVRAA